MITVAGQYAQGMAINSSVDGERRRKALVELVTEVGEVSIEGASGRFNVSSMTIRRDLEALEIEGQLRRVRGGAVPSPAPRSHTDRLSTRAQAKRTIARKAATLIPQRGEIAFDASTTVHALAQITGDRNGIVACTNSIPTFEAISDNAGVEAQLTGGRHEPVTGSLVGPVANAGARLLNTRLFFTSAAALHPQAGTSEASLAEAEVKRHFALASDRIILCLDSSKLGSRSPGYALDLSEISLLITELDPTDALLDPYRDLVELA